MRLFAWMGGSKLKPLLVGSCFLLLFSISSWGNMLHKLLNNWTLYIPYTFIGDLYGNQFASQHPIWLPLDLFRVYNNRLLCVRLRFAIPNSRTIHFSAKVGFLCIKIIVQFFFSSFYVHLCYNSQAIHHMGQMIKLNVFVCVKFCTFST